MTVLVAVASRHGATQEIADAIGRELAACGVETDVRRVEDVEAAAPYDAVVLGSAVYMGSWLESASRFADEHAAELAARPTWLFSSGPVGDPPRPEPGKAVQVDTVVAATHAREHRLFAGRLDAADLGFRERAVMRLVRTAPGDYRDWDEIASWARTIADAVKPA